jgi:hypothetical protein
VALQIAIKLKDPKLQQELQSMTEALQKSNALFAAARVNPSGAGLRGGTAANEQLMDAFRKTAELKQDLIVDHLVRLPQHLPTFSGLFLGLFFFCLHACLHDPPFRMQNHTQLCVLTAAT